MDNKLKVNVKSKQAWVMLRTYLERVFGQINYYTSGYREQGNLPFMVIFTFNSEEDRNSMENFFGFIVHGFEIVPDKI
jgi:hypothetical protein